MRKETFWPWTTVTIIGLGLILPIVWFLFEPGFEPLLASLPSIGIIVTKLAFKNIKYQIIYDRVLSFILATATIIVVIWISNITPRVSGPTDATILTVSTETEVLATREVLPSSTLILSEPTNATTQPSATETEMSATKDVLSSRSILSVTEKMAFVSGHDGNYEIYVANADGTNLQNITNNLASDDNPCWSPNGHFVSFNSNRDGNFEIYIMNADGTEIRRITNNPANDRGPTWSPDSRQIAFYSDRDGNSEIYTVNIDGTAPHRVTNNPADDWAPAWSPNGNLIAFVSDRDDSNPGKCGSLCNNNIYVMNLDGTDQRRLTEKPSSDTAPAWSPDSRFIVYASYGYDEFGTHIMKADGTEQRLLTRQSNRRNGSAWSPDGYFIAFESLISGGWGIHLISIDGMSTRELIFVDAWGPAWAP